MGLAEIEYLGQDGDTQSCLDGLVRLLSYDEKIQKAYLISTFGDDGVCGRHAFVISDLYEALYVIRGGFGSGYNGQGPAGLSKALLLLNRHSVELTEIEVSKTVYEKLNSAKFTRQKVKSLINSGYVRPTRLYDYISHSHEENELLLSSLYSTRLPFGLIDSRIIDLAMEFEKQPEQSLMTGYKRLEDIVRQKADLKGLSGAKLFSKAFNGNESILHWEDAETAECLGRVSLFTGVYMAYRNKRAHREFDTCAVDYTREFMLLNELYVLEASSTIKPETLTSTE